VDARSIGYTRVVFKTTISLPILILALASCSKKEDTKKEEPKPEPPKVALDAQAAAPAQPQIIKIEGMQTPESILFDADAGMYLVSNINGKPTDKDDNGFIARVSKMPGSKVVDEKWIDGAKDDVTLNAPKGMALLGDTLYVADIDAIRMFDRKTGAPKGEVAIKGAAFLNDLAAGDGVIYATDSGLDANFQPGDAQAVYEIKDGKAKALIKGKELGAPNGVAFRDGVLWVNTFVSGELYQVKDGKREAVEKLPKGALDGLEILSDGRFLVTSWEGQTVFHGKPGSWTAGPTIKSPADLGVDEANALMLVPLFEENRIELHELPRVAP
jgi:sugar lactone lactonase YvrE